MLRIISSFILKILIWIKEKEKKSYLWEDYKMEYLTMKNKKIDKLKEGDKVYIVLFQDNFKHGAVYKNKAKFLRIKTLLDGSWGMGWCYSVELSDGRVIDVYPINILMDEEDLFNYLLLGV